MGPWPPLDLTAPFWAEAAVGACVFVLTHFEFTILGQTYDTVDTGPFTVCGSPSADGGEAAMWSLDSAGKVAVTATAKFAPQGR